MGKAAVGKFDHFCLPTTQIIFIVVPLAFGKFGSRCCHGIHQQQRLSPLLRASARGPLLHLAGRHLRHARRCAVSLDEGYRFALLMRSCMLSLSTGQRYTHFHARAIPEWTGDMVIVANNSAHSRRISVNTEEEPSGARPDDELALLAQRVSRRRRNGSRRRHCAACPGVNHTGAIQPRSHWNLS